jgi:phosphoribosyl-dephospho-CoA transferase
MPIPAGYIPQPHDILELDLGRFISSIHVPDWVEWALNTIPFVTCRRSPPLEGEVAIGVRGSRRDLRWADVCRQEAIRSVISPCDLAAYVANSDRTMKIPALQSFELLKKRWRGCGILWGPGGSVGFELATGKSTATSKSDLDIVILAPIMFSKRQAAALCEEAEGLPCPVDIRVETPVSGFSLREYASTSRILLRLPEGSLLGADPWDCRHLVTVKR